MITEKQDILFEGANSIIYQQESQEFDVPIIIKVIKDDHASAEQIALFNNEYEINKNLKIEGIRKVFKRIEFEGKSALVMEYLEGKTLKQLLEDKTVNLNNFFIISLQLCQIIGEIHQNNIIHKDLNSNNVIIGSDLKVKVIDFGIASRITLKSQNLGNPEKLEGTLPYIAPEQTGRMNRLVDHRSDLYSLGVILYEMLTWRLPFENKTALELVHAHLAQIPEPPHTIDAWIPEVLSDIVCKLLRKNAEDRYQSAFGLKADLEKCHEMWLQNNKIEYFEIGKNDFTGKLQIPQKLYGRQKEIGYLLDAFERACQGAAELLLISGYSGVGKSALVHEIQQQITERRGYFIEGKFDQFQRNVPYYAWIQAFKSFVNRLLTESAADLEKWKQKILTVVGSNGKVLTDVFPALELIIGKQPEVAELGASEAQNRFSFVFRNFVNTISRRDHPLVIFVDDWQWADAASLNLLKILLTNQEADYSLFIASYRDNEIYPSHPFEMTLDEMKKEEVTINTVHLDNLSIDNLNEMISETLSQNKQQVSHLSQLIHEKTRGNAFFVNQILKSLYEDHLLFFSFNSKSWVWDMEKIKSMDLTDNVVDLMAEKVQRLSEKTQNVLKLAACIGNRFDLSTLQIINDDSENQEELELTRTGLEDALIEGFVIPLEKDFKFSHDRIQQAAYSLIEDSERKKIHLEIGRAMIVHFSKEKLEELIFDITNHWNYGIELLQSENEKHFLAELNLIAGKKAKDSSAYKPAYEYLKNAIYLLNEEAWEKDYDFTLSIYSEILQAAFLKGDLEETRRMIDVLLEKGNTTLDKMIAFEIEMQYHIAKGNQQAALDAGLRVVRLLNIPMATSALQVENINSLLLLPKMTDPEKKAAMEIMDSIITPAWSLNPDLFQQITFTMVNLSIEYGNSASSCVGYAFYGGLLCSELGDIDRGYQFGKLAIDLLDKYDAKYFKAKVDNIFISNVMHWKEPARATRKLFFDAVQIGLETGEIEFASYNIVESSHYQFLMGINLDSLKQKYEKDLLLIYQLNQGFHEKYLIPWFQMIQNLTNETWQNGELKGEYFDEEVYLPEFEESQQLTLLFVTYQAKAILAYLFKENKKAMEYILLAEKYKNGMVGMLNIPVHNFYYSLILIANFPEIEASEKEKILNKVYENQRDLKNWAYHSPENFRHKYDLVMAETMRLAGQEEEAMKYYDLAIEGAKKNQFLQEEALSNELAAEYYLAEKRAKIAKAYMNDAYYCYQMWGAKSKLMQLDRDHSKLLKKVSIVTTLSTTSTTMGMNSETASSNLDLNTIIKASLTLSGEVVLGKLLDKMLHIVVENAGAQKGLFITQKGNEWMVQAEHNMKTMEFTSLQSIPIEQVNGFSDNPKLSSELVYFVARTRQNVVLNDASNEKGMIGATYVERCQPKSVLCMPLIFKNKLSGILYLENNLTTDAFTPDRLEILKMLSTQMSISIENAYLYENLEEKVRERTAEVTEQKEIIEKKNQDITSSINYAKRIQDAMLPKMDSFKKILPESFVFFRPRDIVSGDFYWINKTEGEPIYEEVEDANGIKRSALKGYQNAKIIVTAVDCTGHGVPGAFMSMIGNELLNAIVGLKGVTDAGKILEEMHLGVREALKQEETDNKDGMDMALCVIDVDNGQLDFSGAKNPLIYIHNNELYEIKGSKMPIGGVQKEKYRSFEKHTVKLESPTYIYLLSDGYPDQFGGEEGRKFMIKKLKKMLLEHHQKPFEEQYGVFKEALENWMIGQKQIDDILIIGFKIG